MLKPVDIVRTILLNMWRAAATGAVFAVTVALVSKTVRSVSRYQLKPPFNLGEERPLK